jgi:hypothetical protein
MTSGKKQSPGRKTGALYLAGLSMLWTGPPEGLLPRATRVVTALFCSLSSIAATLVTMMFRYLAMRPTEMTPT